MSIRELTCIGCPMGCQLTAVMDGSRVTEVTGNTGGVCPHPGRRTQGKGAGCGPGAVPGASDGPGTRRGRGDPQRAGHRRGRGGHPVRVIV